MVIMHFLLSKKILFFIIFNLASKINTNDLVDIGEIIIKVETPITTESSVVTTSRYFCKIFDCQTPERPKQTDLFLPDPPTEYSSSVDTTTFNGGTFESKAPEITTGKGTLTTADAGNTDFGSTGSKAAEIATKKTTLTTEGSGSHTSFVPFIPNKPTCPLVPITTDKTTSINMTEKPTLTTVRTAKSNIIKVCPEESAHGVTWPQTVTGPCTHCTLPTLTVSIPPCLDKNFKIIKRECTNEGSWKGEAPSCVSIQKTINDPCPSDLQWTLNAYCVKIFKNTTFPPPCPYQDTVDFDEYVKLNLTTRPIWMPLERMDGKGEIDLIRWSEKNQKYKTPYTVCDTTCKKYYFQGSFLDKKCLVYHNSTHTEAVRCDSYYAALCVYRPLHMNKRNYCSQAFKAAQECKQSDYIAKSKCFCKEKNGPLNKTNQDIFAAEFIYPYQKFLYLHLEDTCSFGLKRQEDGSFVWANSSSPITYTDWSLKDNINFEYRFGVFSSNGWNLHESVENLCIIYQLQPEFVKPNITLNFNHKTKLFTLELTKTTMWYHGDDNKPLVFCYTDADATTLIYRISHIFDGLTKDLPAELTVYMFSPLGLSESGSGRYWCEGFIYPYMETISTSKIYVLRNMSYAGEYVAILKITDYITKNHFGDNPLTESNIVMMQNLLKNELLLSRRTSFYPRIFKIINIDIILQEITINYHLTSSSSRNDRTEYYLLKDIIQSQKIFDFVDFLSVDYCYEHTEMLNNVLITWPITRINNYAILNGYCVSDEGKIIKKKCGGNFRDGAIWEPTSEKCSFFSRSNTTDALLEILNKSDYLNQTNKILKFLNEPNSLSAFDVVIIARFLKKIVEKLTPDLYSFVQILDKVMNIPRIILLAAQSYFKATDKMLFYIDTVLGTCKTKNNLFYSFENFAVKVVNVKKTFQGITLHNCNNTKNCTISDLNDLSTNMVNKSGIGSLDSSIYAAVILSDKLLNQLLSVKNKSYVPKIAFAIHYNPVLFNEIAGRKNTSVVFGVLLPEFRETFDGPLILVFNNNFSNQNCSFWKFDNKINGEWEYENSTNTNGATYCQYNHLTNLAVVANTNKSHKSKTILTEFDSTEKLQKVKDSSSSYKIFTSTHIRFFTNALESILLTMKDQPELLKDVVPNVLNLPMKIFNKSQAKYFAAQKLTENINKNTFLNICDFFKFKQNDTNKIFTSLLHTSTKVVEKFNKKNIDMYENILTVKGKERLHTKFIADISRTSFVDANKCVPSFVGNITNIYDTGFCHILEDTFFKNHNMDSCVELKSNFFEKIEINIVLKNCYNHLSHLQKTTDCQNISKLLEKILKLYFANDRIKELEYIIKTTPVEKFRPIDVETIAKILSSLLKISFYDNFSHLRQFVHILDSLISFNKLTIIEAQRLYQSSDKILRATQSIFSNHYRYTVVLEAKNFGLVIAPKENIGFGGVYVTHFNGNWSTSLLKEKALIDNLVLAFTMDKNVLNQIESFAVLVFYDDTLFPGHYEKLAAKPIIKIVFPNLQKPLEGNISLTYYNFSASSSAPPPICSFWKYDVVDKTIGFWERENTPLMIRSTIQHKAVCNFNHLTNFALVTTPNITTNLESILNSNLTSDQKLNLVNRITDDVSKNLLPVDIYLISQIFNNITDISYINPNLTSNIVSNLFNVPRETLNESQKKYNATDKILYAIDQMASKIDKSFTTRPNFALTVQNLRETDMIGLFLDGCTNNLCSVLPIDSINEYKSLPDSISALVLFDSSLVNQIKKSNNSKVVVTTFYDNSLFNEFNNSRMTTKIFGVYFPGIKNKLNGTVSIAYNINSTIKDKENKCAHWQFTVNDTHPENSQRGRWKYDQNKINKDTLTFCNFSHVTHFALLLANSDTEYMHDEALNLLTNVNCFLSLLGLMGIMLTAILFKRWRNNTGNKILVNNAIAISMKICMLYISNFMHANDSGGIRCTLTGTALHYAMLSECCWMLIIAILQFKRFVDVLGGPPKYVMVKALICGWIFPVIPVLCVICINPDNYLKSAVGICYPTNLGLYLGVWLPVLIILSINCIIFTFIMYNICKKKTECVGSLNNEFLFQWRLALLLFFILGITWIFGFLSQIQGNVVFVYIFCFTSTLQGSVMFWFFIVFNKSTRSMYTQTIKQWFYEKGIVKIKKSKSPKY